MSEINQSQVGGSTPAAAPGSATSADGAAGVYRRAVESRPTAFTENPIGAMAHAMDRLGSAAGRLVNQRPGAELEGQDGLAAAEARVRAANEAARTNPGSLAARHDQLRATLALLRDMQSLAPNDPRRVKVAGFAVKLANALGKDGLAAMRGQGLDVRGLLGQAARITSRYGDAVGMQAAFSLEGLLRATQPASTEAALALRDQLMQRLGLSKQAMSVLSSSWAVRAAGPGEVPGLDMDSRTMVLSAQQSNPSLGVLARAWWIDNALQNPADKDGFIAAFVKIANQGSLGMLNRKYKELRRMARQELASARSLDAISTGSMAPVLSGSVGRVDADESGDMFAALAVFSRSAEGGEVPASLAEPVRRFFA
jgi:hypothetical protein